MIKKHIPTETINEIIARSDIIEIIRSRLNLVERGHNHIARCPFHEEKTPSFSVNGDKQFYYCFGCGAHGNVISFLMNYDRLEFIDAIEYLAAQTGVPLAVTENHREQAELNQTYPLLQQAANYYRKMLPMSANAMHYLKSRKLTATVCQLFLIGYAPSGWNNLQPNFKLSAVEQQLMVTHGLLISKKAGGCYDRFRDRIMFPIQDLRGRVIAFGGRAISEQNQPKYLNSPETPLFQKSHELYGLYQVRKANTKINSIIVVEGYLDVITLHQYQFNTAVATMGTAVNAKHIQKILRYTHTIIFCFDGDSAGKQAAWKALTISLPLLREGIDIRFLLLPPGEDPDSLLHTQGASYFKQLLQNPTSLSDYFFQTLQQKIDISNTAGKADFIKQATTLLNTIPNEIYRHLLLQQLAKTMDIELAQLQALTQPHRPVNSKIDNIEEKKRLALPLRPLNSSISTARSQKFPKLAPLLHTALSLLLKKPELALNTQMESLSNLTSLKDSLFIKVLTIYQQNTMLSIGELLQRLDSAEEKQCVALLAAKELVIPETGILEEYRGAIACLIQQEQEQKIRFLIQKAKQGVLNENEKKQLQLLIESKHQYQVQ